MSSLLIRLLYHVFLTELVASKDDDAVNNLIAEYHRITVSKAKVSKLLWAEHRITMRCVTLRILQNTFAHASATARRLLDVGLLLSVLGLVVMKILR